MRAAGGVSLTLAHPGGGAVRMELTGLEAEALVSDLRKALSEQGSGKGTQVGDERRQERVTRQVGHEQGDDCLVPRCLR